MHIMLSEGFQIDWIQASTIIGSALWQCMTHFTHQRHLEMFNISFFEWNGRVHLTCVGVSYTGRNSVCFVRLA